MGWSITIGRVAGTAVRIHVTFLLFLGWIGWSNFANGGWPEARDAMAFVSLLFLCVLLHEFGHIFAARRYGIATPDVTLLPIGGVARLERLPETPSQELIVALAGPAVNVAIALVLMVALGGAPDAAHLGALENPHLSMVGRLAAANLFLAAFNLLPAFPMDGGRVLRALLAMRMDRATATRWAARVGQGLAFVFMLIGFMGQPMLFFIALFVWIAAAGEAQDETTRAGFRDLRALHGMETAFTALPRTATLEQAVEALLASPQQDFPVVDDGGRPLGLLTRDALLAALREGNRAREVGSLALGPAPTVRADADLTQAVGVLQARMTPAFAVVDPEGRLVGMLTRQNVAEMMMIRAAAPDWRFSTRG